MRISGYGSGSGGRSGGRRDGAARRRDFRRRHRVGDVVRGRMLRTESEGLVWVEVDGQEMLAAVGAAPSPGARLIFLIRRLEPDIVLQEVPADGGTGVAPDALQRFWRARAVLESAVSAAFEVPEAADGATRKALFLRWLETAQDKRLLFQELQSAIAVLNEALAKAQAGELLCAPWLLPGAYGQELLLTRGKTMDQIAWAFTLPGAGDAELRLLSPTEATGTTASGVRLLLERKETADAVLDAVRPVLDGLRPEGAGELSFQGFSVLPPGPRGPLSRLLTGGIGGARSGGSLPGSGFTARV